MKDYLAEFSAISIPNELTKPPKPGSVGSVSRVGGGIENLSSEEKSGKVLSFELPKLTEPAAGGAPATVTKGADGRVELKFADPKRQRLWDSWQPPEYLVDEILERDSISTEGCGEDIEDSY